MARLTSDMDQTAPSLPFHEGSFVSTTIRNVVARTIEMTQVLLPKRIESVSAQMPWDAMVLPPDSARLHWKTNFRFQAFLKSSIWGTCGTQRSTELVIMEMSRIFGQHLDRARD